MKQDTVLWSRLVFRILVACTAAYYYFFCPEMIDFTKPSWSWFLWFCWIVLLFGLLIRFIPGKIHHFGMQKYLKRNFTPTEAYEELQGGNIKNSEEMIKEYRILNRGALRVLVCFGILNAIVYALYFTGVFRPKEMFMIMMFYYVGDTVCSTIFCPYRTLIMKNRCCTVCRIYSWDSLMLTLPILFVFSTFSLTLGIVSAVHTAQWEIVFALHPERFMETCNENLQCKNCKNCACSKRKDQKLRQFFAKKTK